MFPRCSRVILNRMHGMNGLSATWEPSVSGLTWQCVRWRKRRTDPIAKSKIDYKRIPTPIDPWEYNFLTKKNAHYRTIMRAIRKMFKEEQAQKRTETAEGGSAEERARKEMQEHLSVLEWNQQENARTRAMREERLAAMAHQREEKKLANMIEKEERRRQKLEELADRVRQEKEASKSYFTLDNVQKVIENSLDDPKEYNFMVDKQGKMLLPEDSAWGELKARQELASEDIEENVEEQTQQQ